MKIKKKIDVEFEISICDENKRLCTQCSYRGWSGLEIGRCQLFKEKLLFEYSTKRYSYYQRCQQCIEAFGMDAE